MVRKLALAVSLALGTLSVPAHALGLGELSSKSALNQQFSGDINLLSVAPDEIGTVRVKLADSDAFARSGIERPFYLTLLKFEPTLTAGGRPVVRVTSEFPIREPFLNFLVEVNWPNGRLLREYTVLLDPPTLTMRRPPSVAPVTRSAQAGTVAAPRPTSAPAPAVSGAGYEYGPVKANETAWGIAKKVRPRGVSMEQMMMALLEANPHAFVDGNINRLRKGQIIRVPSSTELAELGRQEARQAYRAQQDAWLARREDKLRGAAAAGVTPQAGAAAADSAATGAKDQLRIATARPEGQGEAGAGDDDAVAPVASDLKSRLIAARENAETSRLEAETLRSRVDELQARLQDMQKLLSLKDDQLAQLQDSVATDAQPSAAESTEGAPADAAAEPATADLTRLPDVTGDDYAIQDIAPQIDPDRIVWSEGVIEPVITAGEGSEVESGIADIPPQIDPDRIVEAASRLSSEGTVAGETTPAPTVDTEVVVVESGTEAMVAAPEVGDTAVGEPQPAPVVQTGEPASIEPPVASDSILPQPLADMVEQNMLPIAAGGGVVLVGLLGWLVARGRRKPEGGEPGKATATATAVAGTDATVAAPAVAAAAAVAAADEVGQVRDVDSAAVASNVLSDLPDSSFLNEFSPSDINALQDETGEVDPVSEADVYIAYGRYQQAEELLRQALSREPDRLALKHKLLEVHYATRDGEAFAKLAQEMVDGGQDAADEEAWTRAQDMGRELAPENPLFALAEAGEGVQLAGVEDVAGAAAAVEPEDGTASLDDLELSELTAAYEEEPASAENFEAPSEVSITLDLDDAPDRPQDPATVEEMPASISLDEIEGLDFEMPEVEKDDVPASDAAAVEEIESLDLDGMMAQAEAAMDADDSVLNLDSDLSADDLQAQLDELSDLSVLDSELGEGDEGTTKQAAGNLGLVEEDGGSAQDALDQPISLDEAFNADEPEHEVAEVIELNEVAAMGGSDDEDDVTTKLDLARAYVEMGDDDGARSILEEVVAEGNDSQRGDAERLLTQLG